MKNVPVVLMYRYTGNSLDGWSNMYRGVKATYTCLEFDSMEKALEYASTLPAEQSPNYTSSLEARLALNCHQEKNKLEVFIGLDFNFKPVVFETVETKTTKQIEVVDKKTIAKLGE